MTIKQQIISEIEGIDNSVTLVHLFELIQLVKQNMVKNKSNQLLYQFAGCLNDTDAQNMRDIVAHEFNKIEGEW